MMSRSDLQELKSEFRVTTEINEATVTIKSRIYYKLKNVFGRIYMLLSSATLTWIPSTI